MILGPMYFHLWPLINIQLLDGLVWNVHNGFLHRPGVLPAVNEQLGLSETQREYLHMVFPVSCLQYP